MHRNINGIKYSVCRLQVNVHQKNTSKMEKSKQNRNDQHLNIFGQPNKIRRLRKMFIMIALRNDKYSLNSIGVWQRNVIDRIHPCNRRHHLAIYFSVFFSDGFSLFFPFPSKINQNLFIINVSNMYAWWNQRNIHAHKKNGHLSRFW